MGTGSFLGVKQPERGVDHPHPSSADIKERVELCLYCPYGPSWPVLRWILPLHLLISSTNPQQIQSNTTTFTKKKNPIFTIRYMFQPGGHYEATLVQKYIKEWSFVYFCNGFVLWRSYWPKNVANCCTKNLLYNKNWCTWPDCLRIIRVSITQRNVISKDCTNFTLRVSFFMSNLLTRQAQITNIISTLLFGDFSFNNIFGFK